jgi:hypothetical protein
MIKQNGKRYPKLRFWRVCKKVFAKVTPAIQDMIQGKRVMTPDAIFRIKGIKKIG